MDTLSSRTAYAKSLDQLGAEITTLAGHLNAGEYHWLTLVAEFDTRKGWVDGACHSCAHWLNFSCGMSLGTGREKVRVAHALETLPKISAAMARGALSYSKVRALTRAAEPATEDYFLMLALHGTAIHAERLVQGFRRAKEAEELSREARQHATRSLTWSYDEDGSMMIRARLPAETGALFLKALDAAAEEIPSSEVPSERVPAGTWAAGASASSAANPSTPNAPEIVDAPTRAARRADALGVLAETFLKQGGHALNGGERYQIIVHVDAETLRDSTAGRCEMEDGPSLPAETVRRFACDSGVVMLLENENGEPLNVGRRTRSIPPAIRRALNVRDKGCRFPGCTHTRYVDAHHIHHWALGGETKTQNLVTLCRAHHRLVHEGSITIRHLDDGAFRFIRPNGKAFDSLPPQPTSDFSQLPLVNDGNGIAINRNTAVSLWRGERCDYGLGVEVLLRQSERGRNVPAGTPGALK